MFVGEDRIESQGSRWPLGFGGGTDGIIVISLQELS